MDDDSAPIVVRQASLIDLTRVTDICLQGLPDDPTFDYLWRYRSQYPEDNRFFWQQRLKAHLFDPKKVLLVAVVNESVNVAQSKDSEGKVLLAGQRQDDSATLEIKEMIVAMAIWERNVKGGLDWWQRGWLDILHGCLTSLENWGLAKKYNRRDGDPRRLAQFDKVLNDVHRQYWEEKHPRNYHLELLVTHPAYRRRGAGTKLIRWGIERASTGEALVGVASSPMGLPLYQSLGFKLCETRLVQVEEEAETLDVRVMVFSPPGRR